MTEKKYHHGNLKAAILQSALRRAAESGPTGISVREIARELHVSPPAIYRHYTNQLDLIRATQQAIFDIIAQFIDKDMLVLEVANTSEPQQSLQQLRAIALGYIHFGLAEPGLFRTGAYYNSDDPSDTGTPSYDTVGKPLQYQRAALNNLVKYGYIQSDMIDVYTSVLWALAHGLTILLIDKQIPVRSESELDALINTTVDIVMRGLEQ